jgi:hypothetical protein
LIPSEIFLSDCHRVFGSSQDWKLRQGYIDLCQCISNLHQETSDQYALRFVGRLLILKEDPVINVRLSLGRFIYQNLYQNGKREKEKEKEKEKD